MHKFITFSKGKDYHRCCRFFMKNEDFQQKAVHYPAVRTFLVPNEHFDSIRQLLQRHKYQVSDEVKVRVHAETIPWGVEKIGAPKMWTKTTGKGIKVGVIDTGISSRHPDLAGQVKKRVVFANRGRGYSKINGHGTHVAGTIAAAANNRGIVGVAPNVELYDVYTFGPDGSANMSDIVSAVNWCIENKMDVVNMSFGSADPHPALQNAIRRAVGSGIVMVASAGNNGGKIEYPAAYRGVISVGAIDQDSKIASFSSRGAGLGTVAPGVKIKSTWLKNKYKELDGTSMAAAHVSGLQALRLAQRRRMPAS